MAGALTFAKSDDGLSTIEDGVTRHAWAWTSDASGDVSGISVTITPGTPGTGGLGGNMNNAANPGADGTAAEIQAL